jgi:hypothetical protein
MSNNFTSHFSAHDAALLLIFWEWQCRSPRVRPCAKRLGVRFGKKDCPSQVVVIAQRERKLLLSIGAGGCGGVWGAAPKRQGRSHSRLRLGNRPSTGGGRWAAGCVPNAPGASWFPSWRQSGVHSTLLASTSQLAARPQPATKKPVIRAR